jgi:hypothetical protein
MVCSKLLEIKSTAFMNIRQRFSQDGGGDDDNEKQLGCPSAHHKGI